MSTTKPYPTEWREQGWGETWQMTPRRRHRTVKKMRRMGDDTPWKPAASYAGAGAKNRPTPRRNGQPPRDARHRWCLECEGTGLIEVDRCNCGGGEPYGCEPLCGLEPCPNGCWDWIHNTTTEARAT